MFPSYNTEFFRLLIVIRREIHCMSDLKDFFNIVFFLTVSIVAVLSYLQARKTLFSPIKTEIFKLQIEVNNKNSLNEFG